MREGGVTMIGLRYVVYIAILFSTAALAKELPPDPRTAELADLKNRLVSARDSLQRDIATRWRSRQKSLEQRETDKEDLATLTDQQEKVFNGLLTIKEERYALERRIETAQKTLDEKRQNRSIIISAINESFEKEALAVAAMFPTDVDSARLRLEEMRKEFGKKNDFLGIIRQLADYCIETLKKGTYVDLAVLPLLPDGEAVTRMEFCRFGTVFGYGKTEDGTVYTVSQSGRDGADRYRIRKIVNPQLGGPVAESFGQWSTAGAPVGLVIMDIMQSDLSGELVSGAKLTFRQRAEKFVKAGGPVMVPLGLLPLWALVLVLVKLIQYFGRLGGARRTFRLLVDGFDKEGSNGVRTGATRKKNAASRITAACVDETVTTRKGAESAAKEVLFRETAHLGSHLNTLAVIAGVAPLLGLLGTVTGMIRLFEVITRFGTGDPKLLAGGISEALITTEVGLIIAVPVLLAHNFLRNYKNGIVAELQTGTLRIINRLYPEG